MNFISKNGTNYKDRIKAACERAEEARRIAKQAEIEKMRKAEEAEHERQRLEQEKLLILLEDTVKRLEEGAEKGHRSIRIDLPLKGYTKDFEYRRGYSRNFVFGSGTFTEKFINILTEELNLKATPCVYEHVDISAYDRDVTYKFWLEVSL